MKVLSSSTGNNRIDTEKKEALSSSVKQKNTVEPSSKKNDSWAFQKQHRLHTLYKTSKYLFETKGSVAFLRHLIRFLRGERTNTAINFTLQVPPNQKVKTEAELYEQWIQKNSLDATAIRQQQLQEKNLEYRPLVSIITPVFNTNATALEKMIESVIAQTYSNWELCLADGASTSLHIRQILGKYSRFDQRIKVQYLNKNLGISGNSNAAIAMAEGEFVALLDHDDELTPDAVYENVALLNQNPQADIIYSDEDKLNFNGLRCEPHFKPDWSPDLFCSMMYTCHLGFYRKSLIKEIGGFRTGFDGAQDYDLVLRLVEKTDKIYHIPKILYHWRKTENSTATGLENKEYARAAQIKAVSDHFKRRKISVEVTLGLAENLLRVKRLIAGNPKVSIIIPTRNKVELLKNCITSIQAKSTYDNYEIIVVDNGSLENETLAYFDEISKKENVKVVGYDFPFNFAAINNFAVDYASGEILLFLNNDTEIISAEWIEAMVEHAVRPEVGAVGARLLYSNGTIQHAGVIIGIGGVAGHSHKFYNREHPGYFSRAKAIQNLSAVTGACMMVRKEVFKSLGGFDEKNLAVAFNDIDFCLRLRQNNLLIIYTPYAEVYHHESISRGSDEAPEKALRFQREAEYMLKVWIDDLQRDPYYNVNLTLLHEDFSIKSIF